MEASTDDNNDIDGIRGNSALLPIFKSATIVPKTLKSDIKIETIDATGNSDLDEKRTVLHNGCYIDIDKLLDQLARSEAARERTEELLVELRKSNSELKTSNTKAKEKIKDLEKDVKNCGRLLNDAEQSLSVTNVRRWNT